MKKRLLLSLLSFQMAATLLVGCGTTSEEAVPKSSGSENSESTESTEAGETENSENEITEINYWTWEAGDGTAGSNSLGDEVEAAINQITEKEIGVHVNFNWVNGADYATQLSLAILNGEQVDVADYYYSGAGTFSQLYSSGSLMEITDLAAEYAPEAMETIGSEVLSGVTLNGKLYGVPT